jgi:hypothetical protein
MKFGWTQENFILNGRVAMLGIIIMMGTYFTTGQVIPGIF